MSWGHERRNTAEWIDSEITLVRLLPALDAYRLIRQPAKLKRDVRCKGT